MTFPPGLATVGAARSVQRAFPSAANHIAAALKTYLMASKRRAFSETPPSRQFTEPHNFVCDASIVGTPHYFICRPNGASVVSQAIVRLLCGSYEPEG